jgi:hypothetical protein
MKKLAFIVLVFGLAFGACNKPAPIELQPEESDGILEFASVVQGDSGFALVSVDSGAMLPEDQQRFAGLLQSVHVVFDGGQRVVDTAYARALFENRTRPVRQSGRIIGYQGMNLGPVRLNSTFLFPVPHRVGRHDSIAGIEYVRDLTALYQPRTIYTWSATPDSIGPIAVSIETPDDIIVHSPRGGAIISRDRDLVLSWSGQGNLFFVISSYDLLTKKSKPIFQIRMRDGSHRAVLSRKILRLLPPHRVYVFTFALANRKEIAPVGFQGRVLVQATSVYNSYVELR